VRDLSRVPCHERRDMIGPAFGHEPPYLIVSVVKMLEPQVADQRRSRLLGSLHVIGQHPDELVSRPWPDHRAAAWSSPRAHGHPAVAGREPADPAAPSPQRVPVWACTQPGTSWPFGARAKRARGQSAPVANQTIKRMRRAAQAPAPMATPHVPGGHDPGTHRDLAHRFCGSAAHPDTPETPAPAGRLAAAIALAAAC